MQHPAIKILGQNSLLIPSGQCGPNMKISFK